MNDYYFVSYSTKDSKVARQMVEYLEGRGVECWIAPWSITPGRDYTDCIDGAIKNSKGIILLYSKYSVVSEWVKKEIARGVSYHKKIIPYKISEAATDGGVNFMLNNVQWIVSMDKPTEKFCEIESALTDGVQSPNVIGGDGGGGEKKRTVWYIVGAIAVALVAFLVWLFPKGEDSPDISVADTTVVTEQPRVDTVTVIVPVETPSTEKKKKEKQKTNKIETEVAPPENVQETKKDETPVHEIGEDHGNSNGGDVIGTTTDVVEVSIVKPTLQDTLKMKYNTAKAEFNKKRYSKALKLFVELKNRGAKFDGLDSYIEECKKRM